MTYRILVTGSRDWTDRSAVLSTIRYALRTEGHLPARTDHHGFVVVHGGCPTGADAIAHAMCVTEGFPVERYPGWEFRSFKERNQYMVDQGADVCLAFALDWASGTGQTARMARRAGIETIDIGVNTA